MVPLHLSPDGNQLLHLAREAIAERLNLSRLSNPSDPYLTTHAATFVTLTRSGELRGCMGSLQPRHTLLRDLRENARSAAFHDPRFSPVGAEELPQIRVEVSLLSCVQEVPAKSAEEAISQIRPGVDGLVIQDGPHRGTFLPQVWDHLPDPREFMRQLRMKAGLSADHWSSQTQLQRYTVEKWKEAP